MDDNEVTIEVDLCPNKCGAIVGHYVTVECPGHTPQTWFELAGVPLFVAYGKCPKCGEVFRFRESDKAMDNIIARHKKRCTMDVDILRR